MRYFIPFYGFWLLYRDAEGYDFFSVTALLWQSTLLACVVVGVLALVI